MRIIDENLAGMYYNNILEIHYERGTQSKEQKIIECKDLMDRILANVYGNDPETGERKAGLDYLRSERRSQNKPNGKVSQITTSKIDFLTACRNEIIHEKITVDDMEYYFCIKTLAETVNFLSEVPIRNDITGIYANIGNEKPVYQKPVSISQNENNNASVDNGGKEYKIGDLGPAHGLIFYDKGHYSNGWRYLEAAPVETEFTSGWGQCDKSLGTALGTGKRNTELINGGAAQLCTSLDFDGYKDWFLPSKDELKLMYQNLKCSNLGDFNDDCFWSSSYKISNCAFYYCYIDFSYGEERFDSCNHTLCVRAVRAF